MTKQLSSGQGGGIERRAGGGEIRTVERGGLLRQTPMLPLDPRFRFFNSSELDSLRPGRIDTSANLIDVKFRGPAEIGPMRFGRGASGRIRAALLRRITELY